MSGRLGLIAIGVLASVVAAAPVLTGVETDQVDVDGDTQTLTGTDLAGATACQVGRDGVWTSCTITSNTATSLAFTFPKVPGLPVPDFDGVNDVLSVPGTVADYTSSAGYSGWALVDLDNVSVANSNAQNDTIIGSLVSQRWGVYVRSDGNAGVYHFDGAVEKHANAPGLHRSGLSLVQWNWTPGTLKIRVSAGDWVSIAAANGVSGGASYGVNVGAWVDGTSFPLNGRIHELGVLVVSLPDSAHDEIAAYVARTWNVAMTRSNGTEITGTLGFDPSTYALAAYWRRGGYSAGLWSGVASAGTSGSKNASQLNAASQPAVSTDTTSGTYTVRVITPAGTSNTLSFGSWGPTWTTSAGIAHRWRADQGLTMSGANVTAVADLRGAMHQSQPSATWYATVNAADAAYGGRPVLVANPPNGAYYVGATVPSIAAPVSMMVVGQIDDNVKAIMSSGQVQPFNLLWRTGSGVVQFYGNGGEGALALTGPAPIQSPGTLLVTDTGEAAVATAAKLYAGTLATPIGTSERRWGPTQTMGIGQGGAGVSPLFGKYAEGAIWRGAMRAGDRTKLAKYKTRRYGLAA